MATIEVNHKTLRDVASAVTAYCAVQDREMRGADAELKQMLYEWVGMDAQEFGRKWEGVDENGSTAVKFRESLNRYAEGITACANAYQDAQEDTYNTAEWLKYFFW